MTDLSRYRQNTITFSILALRFTAMPFIYRLQKKEGGLLLYGALYVYLTSSSLLLVLANILLFTATSLILYSFNDFSDRFGDIKNPKKNKEFTKQLIEHPEIFTISHISFLVLTSIFAFYTFGNDKLFIFGLVILTNAIYCKLLKGIPIFDLLIILICGGLYVFLATTPNYQLAITAGIMTGMPHLFQMLIDIKADRKARVKTTVVRFPNSILVTTTALCLALATSFLVFKLPYLALASPLSISIIFLPFSTPTKWMITRVYLTLMWLTQLYLSINR